MSLSCASPEQLRGEPLTLASDVYALGLLLHELLTGVNPQATGTPSQIRRRIEDGEFPAPSRLDPKVAADLDAIVLKALALDPERRYGSAAELSAEVGRFLDARPVAARPPSRLYYAARFAVRNRALTATAAALLLAILAGSAATLWQAHRAEQNRLLAERRFAEARRLVYTVIYDIQPRMAHINGTLPLRVELMEKTLAYLEALRKDAGDNPALMGELIDGYVALAGISGGSAQANIGDPKRARSMLDQALELGDQLKRAVPPSPEATETLANLYRASALHQFEYGKRDLAVQQGRQALDMSQRLVQARPADPPSRESLAKSVWSLGNITSSLEEKIALYERAAAIWTSEGDSAHRYNIALVYRNLSSSWYNKDDYRRALEYGTKARDVHEILLRENPTSPTAQLALAFDLGTLGDAYSDLGQYGPSVDNWRKSVELRDKVLASNPQDYRAAERVCFALHDLGRPGARDVNGDLTVLGHADVGALRAPGSTAAWKASD